MRARLSLPLLMLALLSTPAMGGKKSASNALTATPSAPPAGLQLVETAPLETTLDHADIPNASDVWLEMIRGASKTVDLSHFYVSSKPGSKLELVIGALKDAGERGVKIRLMADAKFAKTYPDDLQRIGKFTGAEVRIIDFGALAGGVQHAKYMIVDGHDAYMGSQNFDWRSLEHVQELGVRFSDPGLVSAVADVFETDWALAGGGPKDARVHNSTATFPVTLGAGDQALQVTPVFSPAGWIPDPNLEELPRIVKLIDDSKSNIKIQLLNYKTVEKGVYFDTLERALRGAAARGVKVQLMVADWSMRQGTIEGLQSLEVLPNVEVKLVTIPQWSGGFIDYARVVHAKYMVVDGANAWIGTSNWSRDYFVQTRGVGLIVQGAPFAGQLERFFEGDWSSPYAAQVGACQTYTAPKIGN